MSFPSSYNELVIELAVATIYRLKQILGPITQDEFGRSDCFWHLYDSSFETGCAVLWQLGLARGRVTENGQDRFLTYEQNVEFVERTKSTLFMPGTFSFLEEDEIRRDFLIDAVPNPPGTDSIIEAYLRVATDYEPVSENLPVLREPFLCPAARHIGVLNAFVRLGYVSKTADRYTWTGKIGGAMMQASLWTAEDVDQACIDDAEVLKHSLAITAKLADQSALQPKQDLSARGVEMCAGVIMNFWDGEGWVKQALREPVIHFDNAISIAQLLEEGTQ